MEDVCGFHRSEQGLPEGQLPTSTDRSLGRLNSWAPIVKFHALLLTKA